MLQETTSIRSTWDHDKKLRFHSTGMGDCSEVTVGYDGEHHSPEQMFLASLSGCFMKGFLAMAEHAHLQLCDFTCNAVAIYNNSSPVPSIDSITLAPMLTVSETHHIRNALALLEKAHRSCILINSLNAKIIFAPQVKSRD